MNKEIEFHQLLQHHKGILYKIINAYCRNEEDRKDLMQEIIVQLWKSLDQYNPQYKHSTWIYRISLNISISFYRREKRRTDFTNTFSENVLKYTPVPDANPEQEHDIQLLYQFIYELKELDKALMLLYLEKKSQREMAEIIGISETNVATKISRIKLVLKQKFSLINK